MFVQNVLKRLDFEFTKSYLCVVKVVHLTSASSGGAFVAAQRLHEQLQAEGIASEHVVFTGKQGANYTLWASNPIKKLWAFGLHALEKLDFLRFEKSKLLRFRFSHALTGIAIWKNPQVINADIIHIHWVNKGFINMHGLQKLIAMGKPIFWTTHDLWAFTGGWYHITPEYMAHGKFNKKLQKLASNRLMAKTNLWGNGQIQFIAPSQWLADIAVGIMPNINIQVIKNGVDCQQFKIANHKPINNTLTLGFVAANLADKNKNIDDFFSIAHILTTKGFKVKCVLVGSAQKWENNYPGELELKGEIRNQSEIVAFYNSIDAVICTSHMENLPTTLIEAQCCGTAAFGYTIGGVAEILETEFMSPLGNTQELADKIETFFKQPHLTHTDIRNRMLNEFCLQGNTLKTIALYKNSLLA